MTHDTTKVEDPMPREPKKALDNHDVDGREFGDPTPLQPPLGYKRSLSLNEQIAQQVRLHHIAALEAAMDEETDEEADDFEVGDDFEPSSKYENDHIPSIKELKQRALEINEEIRLHGLREQAEQHKKKAADYEARNNPQIGAQDPPKEPSLSSDS